MRECMVHFKLTKGNKDEKKALRANIMLAEGKQPHIADFMHCFRQLGYDTELTSRQNLVFRTTNTTPPYHLEVTKVRIMGETEEAPYIDWELRALLKELIRAH